MSNRSRHLRSEPDPTEDVNGRSYYTKSWALVVGINRYSGGIPRLANAHNDAKAIATILRDQYFFDEVHELYDEQATHKAIVSWLRDELPRRTGENDSVIFFFAGHGVTQDTRLQGKRGYLIPYDAEADKYADYIDMRELLHACGGIAAKHIFIILDCCFSGIAAVSARAAPSPAPNRITDSYLRRITEKGAWQILTAGDSDDMVADSSLYPGHSVFTGVLLQGLEGQADQNRDALFTATDLATYVKPLVTRQSAIATGRSQAPFFNYLVGSGQGDFVFLVPQQEASNDLDEIAVATHLSSIGNDMWRSVKDTVAEVVASRNIINVGKTVFSFAAGVPLPRRWQWLLWGLAAVLLSIAGNMLYQTGVLLGTDTHGTSGQPEVNPTTAQVASLDETATLTLIPTSSPTVVTTDMLVSPTSSLLPTETPASVALSRPITATNTRLPPTLTFIPTNTSTATATPPQTNTPTPMPTPTVQPVATWINSKDGAVYVRIPAGEFLMGSSNEDKLATDSEKPQHKLFTEEFWIMQTEVTNAQYKRCVDAGECVDYRSNVEDPNYPVTRVNWDQASTYAGWAGGRLPTEAEWEKACRGTDGFNYSWGDEEPSSKLLHFIPINFVGITVVGSYPAGMYSLYDMSGNAWEWTSSLWGQDQEKADFGYPYDPTDGREDPSAAGWRVLRGGSLVINHYDVRCAYRNKYVPGNGNSNIGFRVVSSGP